MSGHKCNSSTFAIVDPQERAMRGRSHDFSSSLGNLVAVESSRAKHIPVHFVPRRDRHLPAVLPSSGQIPGPFLGEDLDFAFVVAGKEAEKAFVVTELTGKVR
jgi:hypothetical protein